MELRELIKEFLEEHNMSTREFGRRCGFSNSYVSSLLSGVNPRTGKPLASTMETYEKVAKGMQVSLDYVLERVGYLNGLKVSKTADYNPFFDTENDAYGTDIEWRKRHGRIDDNPRLQRIVDLLSDCDDATLDRVIAIIEVLV